MREISINSIIEDEVKKQRKEESQPATADMSTKRTTKARR